MLGIVAIAPLLLLATWHGWAGGGPPTSPERREAHVFWLWVCLAGAAACPIVGLVGFLRLRRPRLQGES